MSPLTPRYGDLVKVKLFPDEYYGVVVKMKDRDCCRVFVGNGLIAEFRHDQLDVVTLGHDTVSHVNFAEILQQPREFTH